LAIPLSGDALDQQAGDKAAEFELESARRIRLPWFGSGKMDLGSTASGRSHATLEI
jgi:hypothetical protein